MMKDFIQAEFLNHLDITSNSLKLMLDGIQTSADMLKNCLANGGKILICGNGGSAADSQHFAAELTGRYKKERQALPAIALSVDTSALTAIGNDYGFGLIFSRQVEALAQKNDIVFGISTSGNSENVINAFHAAKTKGCKTIALSGRDGGSMKNLCDTNMIVPSHDTARIQEIHILVIHILCDILEREASK